MISHYYEPKSLLEQAQTALRTPEGGLAVNQWRNVQLVANGRIAQVEVFCPANVQAGIRLRRPITSPAGIKYFEIMRFNRKGELVDDGLCPREAASA
jgi:hypothetical protein